MRRASIKYRIHRSCQSKTYLSHTRSERNCLHLSRPKEVIVDSYSLHSTLVETVHLACLRRTKINAGISTQSAHIK